MSDLPEFLLKLLRCPVCRSPLEPRHDAHTLVCTNPACALEYPVREGIPILLKEESVRSAAANHRPTPPPP